MKNSYIKPGDTVAILGFGVSGKAAAIFAARCGARVLVSDARDEKTLLEKERGFFASYDVRLEAGGHTVDFLSRADLVLVSPGVDLKKTLFSRLRERGTHIAGELEVLAGHFTVPVVAVTGTNGKTTVTTLISQILRNNGMRVYTGGNIGMPLYSYFTEDNEYDVVVAEVSSFQLDLCGHFAPDVAVLLNLTPDHLDRHGGMDAYAAAKANIFRGQDEQQFAIINGDDPLCRNMCEGLQAECFTFGTKDADLIMTSDGLYSQSSSRHEGWSYSSKDKLGSIQGQNFAAAALAAQCLNVPWDVISKSLDSFSPLAHRMEYVGEVNGVAFFNDSKATNTGAVIAALKEQNEKVVLIAGGKEKGEDFQVLSEVIENKVQFLVLVGEAAEKLERLFAKLVPCQIVSSLEAAVNFALEHAEEGGKVLLSPACASFDMFTSYQARGDAFREAVRKLGTTGCGEYNE